MEMDSNITVKDEIIDEIEDIGIKIEIDLEESVFLEKEILVKNEEQEIEIPVRVKQESREYSRTHFLCKEIVDKEEILFGMCKYSKTENQCENIEETVKIEEDKLKIQTTNTQLNDYNVPCKVEVDNKDEFEVYTNFKTENQYDASCGEYLRLDENINEFIENGATDEKIYISEVSLLSTEYNDKIIVDSQKPRKNISKNNDQLKLHKMNIHDERKSKVECKFCDKSFARKFSLDDHLLRKHKKEITQNSQDIITNKIHKCKICSYETTSKTHLKDHINSAHNEHKRKMDCQFCDKSFIKKMGLDDHLLKQHKQEINNDKKRFITCKIHACKICFYETVCINSFKNHMNLNHNELNTKVNCQFCSKSFKTKWTLYDHMLQQHKHETKKFSQDIVTTKIHTCNICSYETTLEDNLKSHINSAHNEHKTKRRCQFCNKLFVLKRALEDHLLKQHKQEIKSNMKNFITRKIFTCELCSYETTVKSYLDQHFNSIHNGHRVKRVCQFCNKLFILRRTLDDHMLKIHKQEIQSNVKSFIIRKIHTCKICSYETTVKSYLDSHFNSTHKEHRTKTNCDLCDKSYTSKIRLENHMLKLHKQEIKSN